jgi:hypothetical protein
MLIFAPQKYLLIKDANQSLICLRRGWRRIKVFNLKTIKIDMWWGFECTLNCLEL